MTKRVVTKRPVSKPDPNRADAYGVPWFVDDADRKYSAEEQAAREDWVHETWLALGGPTVEQLLHLVVAKEPAQRTEPLKVGEVLKRESISRSTFDRWWLPRLEEMDPPGAFKVGGTWKVRPNALDDLRTERSTVRVGRPPTRAPRRPLRPIKSSGDAWEV